MVRATLLMTIGLLSVAVSPASAATTDRQAALQKNCWIDVFEDTKFDADDRHVRVQGPIELSSLKNFNGHNWNNEIQSVIVGPDAAVRAYKDTDFKGTEIAFAPGQRIPDLGKLDMSDDIESMNVSCETP